jgi:hypothetical protein
MTLENFTAQWSAQNAGLETEFPMHVTLRRAHIRMKAKRALWRHSFWVATHQLSLVLCIVLNGAFLGNHYGEIKFLIPSVALHLAMLGLIVAAAFQHQAVARMNFDGPIVEVQKRAEWLGVLRIRITQSVVLLSPTLWTPALIVAAKGFFDVDLYATLPAAYLVATFLFGLAWIPCALLTAKRFGERFSQTRFGKSLVESLAGRTVQEAKARLQELADLEGD